MPRLATISTSLLSLLLLCQLLFGQGSDILIENLSLKDGLSNSSVLDVHQDKYGFFWFATEHGLNQFDGRNFTIFRYNPDDPASIKANYVKRLYEDPEGNIWVLYGVGGMSKFDRAKGKFIYYTFSREQLSHPNNFINSLFWDKNEVLWICTQNGFNHIDESNSSYQKVKLEGEIEDLQNLQVKYIYGQNNGQLWALTGKGFMEFSPESGKIQYAKVHTTSGISNLEGNVWRLNDFGSDELFLGTVKEGLLKFNKTTGYFERIEPEIPCDNCNTISALFKDKMGTLNAVIRGVGLFTLDNSKLIKSETGHPDNLLYAFADSSGGIWSLSRNWHFYYQKSGANIAERVNPFPEERNAPGINALIVGKNGNIWVGTNSKGILKFETETPYFNHISDFRLGSDEGRKPLSSVSAIANPIGHLLWVGTWEGLKCFDRELNQFINYSKSFPELNQFKHTGIRMLQTHESTLLLSNYKGLWIWDINKRSVRHFTSSEVPDAPGALSSNGISWVAHSGDNQFWVATDYGLNLLDIESGESSKYFHNAKLNTSLSNHAVSSVLQQKDGTVWAGTIGGGLNKLIPAENNTATFIHYNLQSDNEDPAHKLMTVNVLFEDSKECLWVGTYSRGLLRYNKTSDKLEAVKTTDGLPIPNISGILEDGNGNIWISSNDGLARFDPEEGSFLHFEENDGIQSLEFNVRAYSRGEDGSLYFGGINGFNEFHPDGISMRPKPAKPIFTAFNLFGEPKYFDQPILETSKIELEYSENFIEFDFISIDYDNPQKLQYHYYLENLESSWKRGGNIGTASYANIAPGEYILHVKAVNYEGNASETASFNIIVAPPFWLRTWFITLVVCLIAMGLFAAHMIRVRIKMGKIREIERIREKAAADFHDELGHRLTKISLFTEMIFRTGKPDGDFLKYLEKIRENSNGLYHSMRDFIWAMNPKKDSIFELGILLKDFGDDLFDKTAVNFRVHGIEENQKQVKLNMDWKRHLVLMFKEAMHNTLKHAGCNNATLEISLAEKELIIELTDDGKGFIKDEKQNGYGIGNMYNRAKKLNGSLEINTLIEKGTSIRFTGVI
ncbi:MAG: two-component regulator propeller domain-containing protein [Bacteroidota bacterium]